MSKSGAFFSAAGLLARYGGLIAAIASISSVGVSLSLSLPLLSFILEARGISAAAIGANSAMGGVASILVVPFVTPLAHRFGTSNLLIATILIAATSFVGFYLIDSFAVWFILRVFMFGSITMVFVLSEFWINELAPMAHRGLVLGIYGTVLSAGFAAGPALLSIIGWQGALPFAVGFAILALSVLPVIFTRASSPQVDKEPPTALFRFITVAPLATFSALAFGAVESSLLAFLPVYGLRLEMDAGLAALLVSVATLGNVALQVPVGILTDRFDRRLVILGCGIVGIIGAVLMPFASSSTPALLATLFIWGGVTAGIYIAGLAHLGSRFTGTDLANANSAFVMMYAVGMLVGPMSVGAGLDIWDPHGFAIVNAIIFTAFVTFAIVRIAFKPRKSDLLS
ncbi:MAG: MFS transporter [Hyphomicrobiales bacterium]|nr:MAG: MFS transporter [Hyphomicrobiales bacterium]